MPRSSSRNRQRAIGIDFDNTIVDYDDVFLGRARELGLVDAGFEGNKTQVRDAIRLLPDGNWKWTQLQARVYGPDILRAVPFAGCRDFVARAAAVGWRIFVISHKSRFAAADVDGVDLREAALAWLRASGLLVAGGPLDAADIFFEGERAEKIARIRTCGCTDFIDDLADILWDPAFPSGVRRYHFVGARGSEPAGYRSWQDIGDAVFGT